MPIVDIDGRPRSVRTEEERLEELRTLLASFSDEERLALEVLIEDDDEDLHGQLVQAEYEREPVSPREFLTNDYYLGAVGNNMWPQLQDDFDELFEGNYFECILSGSLGWGKCVTADTEVYDLSVGERRRVDQVGAFDVASMGEGGSIRPANAVAEPSGRKPCVRVVLADGRAVALSRDHKVFTGRGWVEAGSLTMGDLVAVAREVPEPRRPVEMTDEEVKLVAYMASDGGLAGSGVTFTNAEPIVLREVADCVEAVGDASKNGGRWKDVGTSFLGKRGKATTIGLKGVRWFAREAGLTCKAKDKRLPAWAYGLPRRQVALLLNRFWACDGSVSPLAPQKVETTLASERLVDDLQFLLSRLGVLSRKSYKVSSYVDDDGDRRLFDSWKLTVTGADNILAFLDEVGNVLCKENACVALRDACSSVKPNSNTDVVPVDNDALREMRSESGLTGLTSRYGVSGKWMGRRRFQRLCCETGYDGVRAWLADSMIAWEGVRSIEDVGEQNVYDLSVDETHNFVGNGIVLHNSYFASCALLYVIYLLTCMRNPQEVYGLAKGSALAIAMLSATREVARRVPLTEIGNKLQLSSYFKEQVPFKIANTMYEIRFPSKRLLVVAGSTSSAAIGTNVFSAFLDEMAFFGGKKMVDHAGRQIEVDKSELITTAITRRMKSRFQRAGKLPGIVFMVSSKERPVSYIEQRIADARSSGDPNVFIREYATWDVKPQEDFSKRTFQIVVGSERVRAKLDPTPIDIEFYAEQGLRTLTVPWDYRKDFERDLEGSLRDIGGIATDTVSPFIHRVEKIQEAVDESLPTALAIDEWVPNEELEFIWERVAIPFKRRLPGGIEEDAWRPKRHQNAERYAHIDIAYTGDSAGIAIGHPAGWTEVVRRDRNNDEYTDIAPVIESDLLLRVTPPPGDEIVLAELRWVIYQFMEHGFGVVFGSCDSYQSVDTLQQFRARGITAEVISVDKTTAPYDVTKTALYEGRVRLQDNYWCVRELQQLMRVPKPRAKGFKIDHPKTGPDGKPGTKDVADAWAAVVYSINQRATGRPIPMVTTATNRTVDADANHSWVTGGKVMVQVSDAQQARRPSSPNGMQDMMPPFVRG